jgi:diguanylate cyclase (GGDEF)-like protein
MLAVGSRRMVETFRAHSLNRAGERGGERFRDRFLVTAADACVVLWIGSLAAAGLGVGGIALAPVAIGGFTLTILLLGLILREQRRLRNLAVIDALTGLTNHRGFHELLGREIEHGTRIDAPVSLVSLDLDDFKQINDAHGHPYGDEILRAVGVELRSAIRNIDSAARIGGEEFALILPGASSEAAYVVAERARQAIEAIAVSGFELSCSGGIAAFPRDAEDEPTLCQHADSAMRWAKVGGKHRTRRFDPDHSPATWTERQRSEIEELLALEQPVAPAFQPVVSLANGRVIGFEALARFPGAGGRTPDIWFAQAHGCGLGAELEAAAIRAALAPIGRLHETHLAINVSPSALTSDVVRDALAGSLEGLIIEITEHEFVPDDESLAAAIADLRERGAMIAIDDAGAGHAGLKQLMRVRPDIVKIDRDLVHEIDRDPARMALVESFVRYASVVGATVCAEGIETLEELAVLADLDVEWGQGWVLARPEPPWAEVSPIAAEACRTALADTFRMLPTERRPVGSSDRRLVHLSARLAAAQSRGDLEETLALIAAELGATKVSLSAWHPSEQAIETLAENGERTGEAVFPIADYPLSRTVIDHQEAVQAIVGDPSSDPREVELLLSLGERSLLMVPVVMRGESIGIIEAYRPTERPWSRTEINRARVIANQFASVIPTLTQSSDLSRVRGPAS